MKGSVLRRPVPAGENVTREGEPRWDSLRHVELIFSIEDEFGLTFDEADLAELNNLDSLVEAVGRHDHR